jgi:hypothetical protein
MAIMSLAGYKLRRGLSRRHRRSYAEPVPPDVLLSSGIA